MRTTIQFFCAAFVANFFVAPFTDAQALDARIVQINVAQAYVPESTRSDAAKVIMTGQFKNGCYRWGKAVVTGQNSLIEIRSYAIVMPGVCTMALMPFSKEVSLPHLTPGRYLVRVINGDGSYLDRPMSVEY